MLLRSKRKQLLLTGKHYLTRIITMDKVTDVQVEPLKESQYVKPLRMKFKQNGKPRIWDLITLHESVYIIIFNTERKKLICVQQFRPAVYYNSFPKDGLRVTERRQSKELAGSEGITLEWCAGIVDKTSDLAATAKAEVLEECGYDVPLNKFERILSCRAGVGVSGEIQTAYYVEVDDSMKVSEGGGLDSEDEFIEVIEMSIDEAEAYLEKDHVNSPGGFLFGLMWFLRRKASSYS